MHICFFKFLYAVFVNSAMVLFFLFFPFLRTAMLKVHCLSATSLSLTLSFP